MRTLIALSLTICAVIAHAAEKPVVYNILRPGEDPAVAKMIRRLYEGDFRIIEIPQSNAFSSSREIERAFPPHPRDASGKIVPGSVLIEFIISAQGRVIRPKLVGPTTAVFASLDLSNLAKWRFEPAKLNGVPIAEVAGTVFENKKPDPVSRTAEYREILAIDSNGVTRKAKYDPDEFPRWFEDATRAPMPPLPAHASQGTGAGRGVYRLALDLKTGLVTKATTVRSCGYPILDQFAVTAMRKWKWDPGKWKVVDIPVHFGHGTLSRHASGEKLPSLEPYLPRKK